MISSATSRLEFNSNFFNLLFLSIIVILLVSLSNPEPSSFNEFSTIKSIFFEIAFF